MDHDDHLCLQFEAEVNALTTIPGRNGDIEFKSKGFSTVDFSFTKIQPFDLYATRTLGGIIRT